MKQELTFGQDKFSMPVKYPGGDAKLVVGYTKVSWRRALEAGDYIWHHQNIDDI